MAIDKINHYSMTNPASVYDEEALTALELAARTGKKVNEVVEDQNALRETTEKTLEDQNKTLEKFEKVTIPSEVEETVLEHINEGDFDAQISAHLDGLNERVDNMLGSMTEGSTTMDAEIIDARTDPTGKAHANLGERIRDREETVPFPKVAELEKADFLVDFTNYRNFYSTHGEWYYSVYNSPSKVDMKYFTPGTIVFGNNLTVEDFTDLPDALRYSKVAPHYMIVEGYGEKQNLTWKDGSTGRFQKYIKQTLFYSTGAQVLSYHRYLEFENNYCWKDITLWIKGEGGYDIYTGTAEEVQAMVDHTVEVGSAIVGIGGVKPIPENGWLLTVERVSAGWIIQKAYGLHNNPKQLYRIGNNPSQQCHKEYWMEDQVNSRTEISWSEWQEIVDMKTLEEKLSAIPSGGSGGSGAPLPWAGKTIVFLGDSICGNFRDASGVCAQVEKLTGATVKNFCFGGTRIRPREDGSAYAIQDLKNLVSYINKGTLTEDIDATGEEPQHYWREVAEEFDSFDFSTVDLFVIVSGTNDYFSYSYLEESYWFDNASGEGNVPFALGFVIHKLKSFGKGRVLYVAPNYRNDLENEYHEYDDGGMSNISYTGTMSVAFVTLQEANIVLEKRCKCSCIPCLNPLFELGINAENWSQFGEDDVHLNAEGRLAFARFIAGKINQM